MKIFVILGFVLAGMISSGCSTVKRGHNFYRVDGYLGGSSNFSATEVIITNKVANSIAYLNWGVVPLCAVKGGPHNTVGLSYGEKFSFQYNAPPYAGENGLSLSVEFWDETESRILNQEIISKIFPIFYRYVGVYNWNLWSEGGQIHQKIQSPCGGYGGGSFGRFGYR